VRKRFGMGAGCTAMLTGGGWLVCGIYADIGRDGYGGLFFCTALYWLWTWLGGVCFASSGVSEDRVRKWVTVLWFFGYLYLLLRFTLFEPAYDREMHLLWTVSAAERRAYLTENINFIPFHSLKLFWRAMRCGYLPLSVCFANIFGNLAVFAPMPVFLYIIGKKKSMSLALFCTLSAVILVETVQIFTMCGSADVDDLLLNMGGAVFCVGFMKRFWRKLRRK